MTLSGSSGSPPSPWPALLVLTLGVILSGISFQASTFAIADQGGGWDVSADSASWFTTAYAMAEVAAIPIVPFLIAGFGMRRVMLTAGALTAAAAVGMLLVTDVGTAIALRAVQGVAGGTIAMSLMVGVMTTVPPGPTRRLGLVMFAFASSVSTGFGALVAALAESLG